MDKQIPTSTEQSSETHLEKMLEKVKDVKTMDFGQTLEFMDEIQKGVKKFLKDGDEKGQITWKGAGYYNDAIGESSVVSTNSMVSIIASNPDLGLDGYYWVSLLAQVSRYIFGKAWDGDMSLKEQGIFISMLESAEFFCSGFVYRNKLLEKSEQK